MWRCRGPLHHAARDAPNLRLAAGRSRRAPSGDAEADLDTYRREIAAARTAASKGLDDVVPFRWGGPDRDIRWIYLHMIEEYARHNEPMTGVPGQPRPRQGLRGFMSFVLAPGTLRALHVDLVAARH